jgi:hypothetical protein
MTCETSTQNIYIREKKKVNKKKIEQHQELSIQEQEYLKDIWDVRVFGVTPRIETYEYKINFKKIQQAWLKYAARAYAKYALTVLSFGTISHTMTVVNRLSFFINEHDLFQRK